MSDQAGSSQQHLLSQSFLDNNVQSFDLITKQFLDVNIDVYGTFDDPLFNANQIGKLLGIQKIRDTIKGFDDDMKVLKGADTIGGLQQQWFLTENGLYELLFLSRKPIAKQFKKWVFGVIKEIRTTGQYKQKQQYEQREILYQQREKQHQQREEQHQQREQQLIKENERYKKEREEYAFEEEPYEKHLYIFRQGNEQRNIYYIGQSKGVQARLSSHKNSNSDNLKDIHKIRCINDKLCEYIIHTLLEKQGYHHKNDDLSPSSFYRCNLRYILLLSNYVCNTINILYQCRQSIQEDELINKLQEEFQIERIMQQQDNNLEIEFSQQLSFQDNQQSSNLNEEQDQNSFSNTRIDQDDPVLEWFVQNVKYQRGKYILSQNIYNKYTRDTQDEISNIQLNKQINEIICQRQDKYQGIIYKKIDRNNSNGDRQQAYGFANCTFMLQ